jgi:GPH family glycoside/pentoside/hexuronide:cation symporter
MNSTRRTLFYIRYAMGNFANTIAYQVFGNRIQFYYVDILGLNAAVAGIIWTIYGFWNAINDPLMGQISDRTRSRMGRRVPYVLFGAIPLGLSFFFLWTPPGHSPAVLAAYFFLILFIFDGLYSLTWIAYTSLFPEIATTVRDRVNLSAAREVLAVIALLLSYILAPILADTVGYIWMGAIMGALVAIGYLVSTIGIRERPLEEEGVVGLLQSLKNCPLQRALPLVPGREHGEGVHLAGPGATLPFWRKYALGILGPTEVFGMRMNPGDAEALLLGVPILLTAPSLLLWRPIVPRLGYRRAWILASFVFIPASC